MDNKDLVRIGLIILAGVVLMYLVNTYSKTHSVMEEEFYDGGTTTQDADADTGEGEEKDSGSSGSPHDGDEKFYGGNTINDAVNAEVMPSDGNDSKFSSVEQSTALTGNQRPKDCFPKDQLTPAELLPGDANSTWAQVNPAGQGELGDQNFLQAGHHVGVNTVGQTLRNANMQLRSEPPNPQVNVSPWMNSTINPDLPRRPLEVGESCPSA